MAVFSSLPFLSFAAICSRSEGYRMYLQDVPVYALQTSSKKDHANPTISLGHLEITEL